MNKDEAIGSILEKFRTVAIVGLSRDSSKDSYKVAEYLKLKGYSIIPINPFADEILGRKSYKSLLEIPEDVQKTIEIIDIFRPAQDVLPIVEQAIQMHKKNGNPQVIWMQLGIINEEAAKHSTTAGLTVIMDKCMMIEHKRLMIENDPELEQIRRRKMQQLATTATKKDALQEILSDPITLEDTTFNRITQQYPLMVIDCWATWCGPCAMVAPVIDELARDYAGRVVFGKLNVDENPETAMKYGVMSIPTLLILKSGREVERIVGAVPRQLIEGKLRRHLQKTSEETPKNE